MKLLEKCALPLITRCINNAMQNDRGALKLCIERILPVRRETFAPLKLPQVQKPEDIAAATGAVVVAIAKGLIPPSEGEKLMNTLEAQHRLLRDVVYDERLAKAEEKIADLEENWETQQNESNESGVYETEESENKS